MVGYKYDQSFSLNFLKDFLQEKIKKKMNLKLFLLSAFIVIVLACQTSEAKSISSDVEKSRIGSSYRIISKRGSESEDDETEEDGENDNEESQSNSEEEKKAKDDKKANTKGTKERERET